MATVGVAVVTAVNCPPALYVSTGMLVAPPVGPPAVITPPTSTLEDVVPVGKSPSTMARYVGEPLPLVGPARKKFCAALDITKLSAGVVVDVATEVVNNGDKAPAENVVTVPEPDADSAQAAPVQLRNPIVSDGSA